MEKVSYDKTEKTATVTLTLDEINKLLSALYLRHDGLTDWINESYDKIDPDTAKAGIDEIYDVRLLTRDFEYTVLDIEGHAFFRHLSQIKLPA